MTVYEVGPRDGLQAEADIVPTSVKVEFCRRLYAAGVRDLEVTSFVPATWIPSWRMPQTSPPRSRPPGRARRGPRAEPPRLRQGEGGRLRRGRGGGQRDGVLRQGEPERLAGRRARARRGGDRRGIRPLPAHPGLCVDVLRRPLGGAVPTEVVADLAARLHSAGARTIALGDTIGVGTPGQTRRVVGAVRDAGVPVEHLALHLHDTYGQSLANVHAALQLGVAEFDASTGGLGRCPYAKGATGNLATEDLVWMLHGLGIETGLDLRALAATTQWLARVRGIRAPSRVAAALAAAGLDETTSSSIQEA
ncbi:hydroxymethylglutaryl-CoA lyase [Microbacterium sp. NIBRBAC000506063]|uniref:hydroxymethylglutaryl-CoA lyase n=1 Tax=Microbacterium sp. NIBRBAC000506063 TaxID=2734618 RepID=UPI001CB73EE9|nr:hydroxymethylglutaryl-CoA lyase [Microbacterium sp. NIBRBAC000506063]